MKKSLPLSLKDEELVRLYIATKKQSYFETLYGRYYRKVYRKCIQLVKDPDLAQDYTHDIFMQVILKVDRFQERSMFATWLYALTRNYCISKLRNGHPVSYMLLDEFEFTADDYGEPTEHKLHLLQEALSLLPAEEVSLLIMKYNEELDLIQIGKQLTLTVGAVKMRLKRSREKLKKHILSGIQA